MLDWLQGLLEWFQGILPSGALGPLLAVLGAVAIAIFARLCWELVFEKWLARVRAWRHARSAVRYDGKTDGLYAINTWSPDRLLRPHNLQVSVSRERPTQNWVDHATWSRHHERLRESFTGLCGYVTSYGQIDFREGPTTEVFRVTLSPCDYSEGLATWNALDELPQDRQAIAETLDTDPLTFVQSAPPLPLAINVAVLSPSGRFLAIQRSTSVASVPNIWTAGPCETLALHKTTTPADRPEDFFALAQRCLKEEVGLDRVDYGDIAISWFGYYGPQAHPWVFAQVRANLTEAEIDEKMRRAHSAVEAASTVWLPLTRTVVRDIVGGRRDERHVVVERSGERRRWLVYVPLAVTELWRMQVAL